MKNNNKKHSPELNDECLVDLSSYNLAKEVIKTFLLGKNYDFIKSFINHLDSISTYHCKLPDENEV